MLDKPWLSASNASLSGPSPRIRKIASGISFSSNFAALIISLWPLCLSTKAPICPITKLWAYCSFNALTWSGLFFKWANALGIRATGHHCLLWRCVSIGLKWPLHTVHAHNSIDWIGCFLSSAEHDGWGYREFYTGNDATRPSVLLWLHGHE